MMQKTVAKMFSKKVSLVVQKLRAEWPARQGKHGASTESGETSSLAAGTVREALDRLPASQRNAVVSAYYRGHTVAQLASAAGGRPSKSSDP